MSRPRKSGMLIMPYKGDKKHPRARYYVYDRKNGNRKEYFGSVADGFDAALREYILWSMKVGNYLMLGNQPHIDPPPEIRAQIREDYKRQLKELFEWVRKLDADKLEPDTRATKGTPLPKLIDDWQRDKEDDISSRSIKDYRRDYREFVAILKRHGVKSLQDLLKKDAIKKYRKRIKQDAKQPNGKVSKTYFSSRFRRVKAVINHIAREFDYLDETDSLVLQNNIRLLQPQNVRGTKRPLKDKELQALLAACDHLRKLSQPQFVKLMTELQASYKPNSYLFRRCTALLNHADQYKALAIQLRALLTCSINMMFYAVDLERMPQSSIDWDTGHVRFEREKKSTLRVGCLFPECLSAIKEWYNLRTDASDLVFLDVIGSPWNKDSANRTLGILKDISARLGAPMSDDLTFKAFRQGGMSAALLDPNVDGYTVKVLAGHETGITGSYVDAQPERCRLAAESIRRHYFGGNN